MKFNRNFGICYRFSRGVCKQYDFYKIRSLCFKKRAAPRERKLAVSFTHCVSSNYSEELFSLKLTHSVTITDTYNTVASQYRAGLKNSVIGLEKSSSCQTKQRNVFWLFHPFSVVIFGLGIHLLLSSWIDYIAIEKQLHYRIFDYYSMRGTSLLFWSIRFSAINTVAAF